MKNISIFLENLEESKEVSIKFLSGESFGMFGFDIVDESIYQSTDVCMGTITSIISVDKNICNVGTMLEFSVNDIIEIKDPSSGEILYERSD